MTASLAVGYDGEDIWVYVAFSASPNLQNNITKDGYNLINTRIKWDKSIGKYIHHPALKFENDEEERIFLKVMKENMDEYSVKGATGAVQKLVGDMLNGMLGEELKEHLGFDKYD